LPKIKRCFHLTFWQFGINDYRTYEVTELGWGRKMRAISIGLAIIAFAAGLRAAHLWYKASTVHVMPMWDNQGYIEPVDPVRAQGEWSVATQMTILKSGELNRRGAIWTAAAVALSTASTLMGALA
jgi:hypothetical protein